MKTFIVLILLACGLFVVVYVARGQVDEVFEFPIVNESAVAVSGDFSIVSSFGVFVVNSYSSKGSCVEILQEGFPVLVCGSYNIVPVGLSDKKKQDILDKRQKDA